MYIMSKAHAFFHTTIFIFLVLIASFYAWVQVYLFKMVYWDKLYDMSEKSAKESYSTSNSTTKCWTSVA